MKRKMRDGYLRRRRNKRPRGQSLCYSATGLLLDPGAIPDMEPQGPVSIITPSRVSLPCGFDSRRFHPARERRFLWIQR